MFTWKANDAIEMWASLTLSLLIVFAEAANGRLSPPQRHLTCSLSRAGAVGDWGSFAVP